MTRARCLTAALLAAAFVCAAAPAADGERGALRVCADPNNMPLSNQAQEGYENKIAAVLADALGLPLEFTWFPQRRGFVRKTLRNNETPDGNYPCDLIIGVPESFELAITTEPYYRSTYVMVFKKDGPLADVASIGDFLALPPERRDALRIGVFEQSPGTIWLARNGMIPNIVPYITLNADPAAYPGQIIEDGLIGDTIDAAILWGPIAGYYVKRAPERHGVELRMLPMKSGNGLRFDFPVSMAVRFGEGDWKREVETLIGANADRIDAILRDYGVPLVDENGDPR